MRSFTIVVFFFFTLAPMAFAVDNSFGTPPGTVPDSLGQPPPSSSGSNITLINPLGSGTSVMAFLLSILDVVTNTIGPVIVILMLVYVGFKFVAARGVPAKIEEAKGMLLWTVVGALILLGAKVIAMGIEATVKALATGG